MSGVLFPEMLSKTFYWKEKDEKKQGAPKVLPAVNPARRGGYRDALMAAL